MKSFRFVHAADLHLDSPFAGLTGVPDRVKAALRSSTFRALNRLVELAVREQADFVLIAGDVYETADRSLRAQVRFQQAVKRLAESGISAFVVHGNHDPADGRSARLDWPESVHVFPAGRAERVRVNLPGKGHVADIWGISYPTAAVRENYALQLGGEGEAPYRIGLLHANVDGAGEHADYAPCSLRDLTGRGFDYWALGHVHTRRVLHERPYVVYPGNIQGRSVRETGAKGCYVVDVDETGAAALTFHPLDAVRWDRREVSIAGLETEQELKDRLEEAMDAARTEAEGRPVVLRLELTGRGPLHRMLQGAFAGQLLEELRQSEIERGALEESAAGGYGSGTGPEGLPEDAGAEFVWPEALKVRTGLEADLKALAASEGLLGEVLRLSEGLLEKPEELLRFAEECIGTMTGHPRAGSLLRRSGLLNAYGTPETETASEWLRQAAEWLADRLLEGNEAEGR